MSSKNLGEEFQQALMDSAVTLDHQIFQRPFPAFNPLQKILNIFLDFFGMLFGTMLIRWPPSRIANGTTASLAIYKAGRNPPPMRSPSDRNILTAKKYFSAFQNPSPAILILISHPQALNTESRMMGDLIYHAVQVTKTVSPNSKLKLMQATDSFALDSLPWFLKGIYAGLISTGHIAVDRQPYERDPFEKCLFHKDHYDRAIFKILSQLECGNAVCAALGGGVVHNARIFYTVKEFAQRVFFQQKLRSRSKRELEIEMIRMLSNGNTSACAIGSFSSNERARVIDLLKSLGMNDQDAAEASKDLEEEIQMQTPYRLRLFRILFGRICSREKPLLILPLRHLPTQEVLLDSPALIRSYDRKTGTIVKLEENFKETSESWEEFVKTFVRDSLNP